MSRAKKSRTKSGLEIKLGHDLHNGKRVAEVALQLRRPTWNQADEVLVHAEGNGVRVVRWNYGLTYGSTPYVAPVVPHSLIITRCECTEMVIGDDVCRTCRLLASLVTPGENDPTDVDRRYQRADRALMRLAVVVDDLKRKQSKGAA